MVYVSNLLQKNLAFPQDNVNNIVATASVVSVNFFIID